MKTKIIDNTTPREINWDKPQLMKDDKGTIILSTGRHHETIFNGVVIYSQHHQVGTFVEGWPKYTVNPLADPITIEFIPE